MTTQAVITPIGRVRATTIMVAKVTTEMPFRIGRPVTVASAMLVAQAATTMNREHYPVPQFTFTRITNKAMVVMNESDDVEVGYRSIFNLLVSGLRLVWLASRFHR